MLARTNPGEKSTDSVRLSQRRYRAFTPRRANPPTSENTTPPSAFLSSRFRSQPTSQATAASLPPETASSSRSHHPPTSVTTNERASEAGAPASLRPPCGRNPLGRTAGPHWSEDRAPRARRGNAGGAAWDAPFRPIELCGGARRRVYARNPRTARKNSAGRSIVAMCAASANTSRRAPGISRSTRSAAAAMNG